MKSDAWCASMKYEFQTVVPCAKFAFDLATYACGDSGCLEGPIFVCILKQIRTMVCC